MALLNFVGELAANLAARFGLTLGDDCFHTHLPDVNVISPVVFVLGTGGMATRFDNAWYEPTVQIRVMAAPMGSDIRSGVRAG